MKAIIKLKDEGQDFIHLDILDNNIIKGNSPLFSNNNFKLFLIATADGSKFFGVDQLQNISQEDIKKHDLFCYIKDSKQEIDPMPRDAKSIKYPIEKITLR